MWVFDGEEWTEEGASEQKQTPETVMRIEEFVPELQVVEIVPVRPNVPMPPLTRKG